MLAPYASCTPEKEQSLRKNWAGNYTYKAENLYQPASVEEVQELVGFLKSIKGYPEPIACTGQEAKKSLSVALDVLKRIA